VNAQNFLVDKIIISQESIVKFANNIHPGSCKSETQVDFRALDGHKIKPVGVYGSIPTIVDFLMRFGCIDEETYVAFGFGYLHLTNPIPEKHCY
jgi:hypothetical protein